MSSGYYPSAQYPLARYCPDGLSLRSLSARPYFRLLALNLQTTAQDFFNNFLNKNKVTLPDLVEASA